MLTESDLQTPAWLAAIVSGSCVVIRGHVGEHRLEGLKAILPLGAFQWVPIELPQGEALDPEFFASIMPAMPGEVPRKVYIMPLVASTVQIDALAEVRASQPWLQWIAVVPDPEINPVLPDGILLFDTKSRVFCDEAKIPAAARSWAEKILEGTRSEEEKHKAVTTEGPKILATINAVSAGEYQTLPGTLGKVDANYITQLITIASAIAGVEGADSEAIMAEIEENATIEETIAPNPPLPAEGKSLAQNTSPNHQNPISRPQIFENGKALPIYPPGDPAEKYVRELDAMRRDPEVNGALLEILQELSCEDENRQRPQCADQCNDPAQKWACMRDHAWGAGVPSAIVDHWLEVFALMVARVGRKPREAYQSFANVMLQASAASPTFSKVNFEEMVRNNALPAPAPPSPSPSKPSPTLMPKKVAQLPLPLKPQKLSAPIESRAQKLTARLDAIANRIEKLKEKLNPSSVNASTPQPANDPLPATSAASSWEAGELGDEDLSLDALERRVARLAHGK